MSSGEGHDGSPTRLQASRSVAGFNRSFECFPSSCPSPLYLHEKGQEAAEVTPLQRCELQGVGTLSGRLVGTTSAGETGRKEDYGMRVEVPINGEGESRFLGKVEWPASSRGGERQGGRGESSQSFTGWGRRATASEDGKSEQMAEDSKEDETGVLRR